MANKMAQAPSKIDILLNLVPDHPERVLQNLQEGEASAQDSHGYSLLHAAASYGHINLLKALVETHHVSPNIKDEDNETPLFFAETTEVAQCLLQLGADIDWKSAEGLTAEEKIEGDAEFPLVAAFLRQYASNSSTATAYAAATQNGELGHPPPLPSGVKINVGTMQEPQDGDEGAPDPEFRRRIEELAAREDFEGEEGQRELRDLITDAVTGIREQGNERDVRRRMN